MLNVKKLLEIPYETDDMPKEYTTIMGAVNRVAAEAVTVYPQGSRLSYPGSKLTNQIRSTLIECWL